MPRLSSDIEQIQAHYDVVIIGSGYGGAIAASRLSRVKRDPPLRICLLERGKEFQPGEYPDTETEAAVEFQLHTPEGRIGSRTGLYELHADGDLNVFKGCGLGGTSLVNANVSLPPEPRVFDDPRWPAALRADLDGPLQVGFNHAWEMLKPVPYPDDFPRLPKLDALETSARQLQSPFYRPPINVNFTVEGENHVGVEQRPCVGCGDCVSGCNYSAKNTVLMNYLPDAKNHGAEIFTQVDVRYIARAADGKWLVYYQPLQTGQEAFDAPPESVTAESVIVAGGTLGSTEILLRSKANGLPLSDRLGEGFTGNGDVLAFAYNAEGAINGVGFGHRRPGTITAVGPCITGIIDRRPPDAPLDGNMVIEEGSIPGALASLLPVAFAAAASTVGQNTESGIPALVREKGREMESLLLGAYHGAMHNTQTYLVMAHDGAKGRMALEDDRLRIRWPGVGAEPIFQMISDNLDRATEPIGGYYVEDPIWSRLLGQRLVSVHPLGGCAMGESAETGVVNHKGQAFAGAAGDSVYEGLYVADGSIIPRSLGVNPLLTISALAERSMALLAQDRGWEIDYTLPFAPHGGPAPDGPKKVGIQFTETMRGFVSNQATESYDSAEARGRQDGSQFRFTLTIFSEDLDTLIHDSSHPARMIGEVNAPALSLKPITVTDGAFQLFPRDPNAGEARQMLYRMKLTTAEGRAFWFAGYKEIPDGPFWDAWPATTTLYVTIYDGESDAAPVWGKGILRISPSDFVTQMKTMQATSARSVAEKLDALARFGAFFGGTLWQAYGGVAVGPYGFDPNAPPRKKRPLRVGEPEIHTATASDGIRLLLTRYWGGDKGPVILSHGLGVSSLIYAIDTIETNLLEYLYAHGYDVWLLDYRASILMPEEARAPSTADDVATKDYPAAVQKVRELTGRADVQMVVHCYGSTTFFMAMLAGLQGVRSAVASQIATHIVAPTINNVRSGLHLPDFLDDLGIDSLTAYADTHENWVNRLYDKALNLYALKEAQGRCNSAVCHRITFMYASLYEHGQLNAATHDALHEMFDVANIKAFEQLALLIRTGHLVTADDQETYLPHLDRLAIPIAFIHGANNQCFLPESTALTYDLLCRRNGSGLYSRHVVPGYGHIDCIFGQNAARDVYPLILQHLEKTA